MRYSGDAELTTGELIKAAQVELAKEIAVQAHNGQTDKIGNPYVAHCERVAELVVGPDERAVAYLHDVVKKGEGWTLQRLAEEGFPDVIITAVDAMTRRDGEDEETFLKRSTADVLARPVKRADLEDNLVQAEQAGTDPSKYVRGLRFLEATQDRP
jgi:(p)ppGpp synthase/HD superfamily hydrolase